MGGAGGAVRASHRHGHLGFEDGLVLVGLVHDHEHVLPLERKRQAPLVLERQLHQACGDAVGA
eukprot:7376728-Prymnesium_polylepis.2